MDKTHEHCNPSWAALRATGRNCESKQPPPPARLAQRSHRRTHADVQVISWPKPFRRSTAFLRLQASFYGVEVSIYVGGKQQQNAIIQATRTPRRRKVHFGVPPCGATGRRVRAAGR